MRTQTSLHIHTILSVNADCVCFNSLQAIQRGINENPYLTGWMYRLNWVFAGHTYLIVGFVVHRLKCYLLIFMEYRRTLLRGNLTLVLLNKLRWQAHLQFTANQIIWSGLLLYIHMLNVKQCRSRSVGFFRSQLIWIYTICKGKGVSGFSRTRVNILVDFLQCFIRKTSFMASCLLSSYQDLSKKESTGTLNGKNLLPKEQYTLQS